MLYCPVVTKREKFLKQREKNIFLKLEEKRKEQVGFKGLVSQD